MGEHIVTKRQTLSGIAKQYGMNLNDLLKLNGLTMDQANKIQIGQKIKIKPTLSELSQPAEVRFTSKTSQAAEEWAQQQKQATERLALASRQATEAKRNNTKVEVSLKPQLISKTKDQAINLQKQLVAAGYDLGPYGIDGNFGNTSKKALAQAQADGYVLENGKLILPKKSTNTTEQQPQDNIAYVNLLGYKAFGVLPTGHAGVVVRDASGMNTYYDFGAKHTSKSGFARMNTNTSDQNTDYRKVELGRNLSDEELGRALGQYFPDNDEISFYWKSGNAQDATKYLNDRAKTNYNQYNSLTNNCSSEAECAMEAAGINFDGAVPSIDVPAWNTPENARHYKWSRSSSPEEAAKAQEFQENLNKLNQNAQALYDAEYKGKSAEEIRQLALAKSRDANTKPNTNFMTATDMMDEKKLKASRNATNSYSNCINTITGFFNPTQTVSSNISFTQTPGAYGFQEVSQEEAQPGDVGILHNEADHPYHAVMLDSKAGDGSWNLNYSNGDSAYRHGRNISAFKDPSQKHKLDHVKYYRYVGNNDSFIDKATRYVAPVLRFYRSMRT